MPGALRPWLPWGTAAEHVTVPVHGTHGQSSLSPMKRVIHGSQPGFEHVCINLGRRDIRMAEHRLNGAQIRAALEQMRRERMPQHVRTEMRTNAGGRAVRFQQFPESESRQSPSASRVEEEKRHGALDETRARLRKVAPNPPRGFVANRHDALLSPLAQTLHVAVVEPDVGETQRHEL